MGFTVFHESAPADANGGKTLREVRSNAIKLCGNHEGPLVVDEPVLSVDLDPKEREGILFVRSLSLCSLLSSAGRKKRDDSTQNG